MSGVTTLGSNVETGAPVRLNAEARQRGSYVVGLTGTGKTTLLLNIVVADMEAGDGLCLLDPHGDLTEDLLVRVPGHRERDVILFDPADVDRPFGLNLFECADPANPHAVDLVCSQALGTFWKLFHYSWGPQMEDLLRNVSLTVIYNQPEATMADIPALLLDEEFRAKLVANIPGYAQQVRLFWEKTYNPLGERYPHKQLEYSLSSLNKVRRFLLNTAIRNIVGQKTSSIDLRRIMDEGRILLVNLAKGKIGEDNSSLLGSIIVGKILIAALSRADTPPEQRRPFHLIVDEYQNFATSSFAVLQSEARKYNIDTIVAHQFRDQLDEENKGSTLNVGNLVFFRVSGKDAKELAREFDTTPPEPLVVGERARRALAHSPWSELVKGSHLNPRVAELVEKLKSVLTVGLAYRFEGDENGGLLGSLRTFQVLSFLEPGAIGFCIDKLDAYLAARMRGVPDSALRSLRNAIVRAGPFGYAVDHYDHALMPGEPAPLAPLAFASGLEEVRRELERLYPDVYPGVIVTMITRVQLKRQFWDSVQELGSLLEEEPISSPTGQTEPIYESQRLYSDVEAEMTNQLSTLGMFQARCRLIQGRGSVECAIKTFPPPAVRPGGRERVERIRARSRQKYGRSRSLVERKIPVDRPTGATEDSAPPGFWGE